MTELPEDISSLVFYHLHKLNTIDVHSQLYLFDEIQEFWGIYHKIVSIIVGDFIDNHIHNIFHPFYTSPYGNFEKPVIDTFNKAIDSQIGVMNSFRKFEIYIDNEINEIIKIKNLGVDVILMVHQHDPCDIELFNKLHKVYSHTVYCKRMKKNMFDDTMLLFENSIRKSLMYLYNDPDFQIF